MGRNKQASFSEQGISKSEEVRILQGEPHILQITINEGGGIIEISVETFLQSLRKRGRRQVGNWVCTKIIGKKPD